MYKKAVQRAEAIGGFGGDELVIGMGDMVKKHRKSLVVSWLYSFLKKINFLRVGPANNWSFLTFDFRGFSMQKNISKFQKKKKLYG